MRIAVCDDEKEIRDFLISRLKGLYPEAEIGSYSSGIKLLAEIPYPDILLLDIGMPEMDGMEVARELRKKNEKIIIIFVTAMEDYVFQAFDVGAFHYLVKPFSDEKLNEVLQKAVRQCREHDLSLKGSQEEKYIIVKTGGTRIRVNIGDIVYAEVFNRKITIHKKDEDITYYGKMSELEKQAGKDFFRTHRAYLVHFKYVERYDATAVYLKSGTALMAKTKFPEFVKGYLRYNQREGER